MHARVGYEMFMFSAEVCHRKSPRAVFFLFFFRRRREDCIFNFLANQIISSVDFCSHDFCFAVVFVFVRVPHDGWNLILCFSANLVIKFFVNSY